MQSAFHRSDRNIKSIRNVLQLVTLQLQYHHLLISRKKKLDPVAQESHSLFRNERINEWIFVSRVGRIENYRIVI